MYKNQLQELAQRSCFNLPSYSCIREGPDHAPRFKATVNFNGEIFQSPHFCNTLRQAEHSAAELALLSLSTRSPSHSRTSRILDETGVYKNLLQEIAQRVGAPLPQYTTFRSGLGHQPVFTGTVELAGITFTGDPAKNKKQAEKNAAMAAWSSLKQLAKEDASSSSEPENNDELEQITISRALLNYRQREKIPMSGSPHGSVPFQKKFPSHNLRPTSPQPPLATSKILPLIYPKTTPRNRPISALGNDRTMPYRSTSATQNERMAASLQSAALEALANYAQKFPAGGATPYVPMRQYGTCQGQGLASPVRIRTAVPCFSAPSRPSSTLHPQMMRAPAVRIAPPVTIRQAVPVNAAPPLSARKENPPTAQKEHPAVSKEGIVKIAIDNLPTVFGESSMNMAKEGFPAIGTATASTSLPSQAEKSETTAKNNLQDMETAKGLELLKI